MKYEKIELEKVVLASNTLSEVARNIGILPTKGNRDTIKKYINLFKIDISHFNFRSGNVNNFKKIPTEEILVPNSTFSRKQLKARLFSEKIKENKCELCGQGEEWCGKKMSLILDHINGINNDNRIENLRIVCPNCNSTLDTNCSKNKTEYKEYLKNIQNKCIECNQDITFGCKRCTKCDQFNKRKVERPSISEIIDGVKEIGYVAFGKRYGVSDNTVRKWIKINNYE
jgi:5-methylcytosine-specific restriction endonuclease McrA